MLKPAKLSPNHEDLFLQRYTLLRGWALRLTGNDPQQAEDLLHDAFIHFCIHHPALEEIKNLEGYLHTMLRNLHLSQSRRAARSAHGHFLILDYDSAETGWSAINAIDPREQIKAQDELRAICEYACLRKESSKAGSVLILRFFHGYYPDEIARVMRSTRSAVEHHLRLARSEAKVYLQDPDALTFMQRRAEEPNRIDFGITNENILENLRHAIFHSSHQACLTVAQLDELYDARTADSLHATPLAHIVSCLSCLESVNKVLGLPSISERDAASSLGPRTRSQGNDKGDGKGGDSSGGGGAVSTFANKSRRRMKEVLKHSPHELHISVNGFILGSQRVSSETSELTLNVSLDERIGFVEVFSENDVRLFFLNIEQPPDGPVEQPSRIQLSDDRSLEVALNFSDTWPRLHVLYRDPLLAPEFGAESSEDQSAEPTVQSPKSSPVRSSLARVAGVWTEVRRGCAELGRRLTLDPGLFLRPGIVTAIFAALLMAILFVSLHQPTGPASATELLRQSQLAEEALAAKADLVLHRTINVEERSVPRQVGVATASSSQLIARRRIELWQNGTQRTAALRVYDEENRLVDGEWTRSDGTRAVYNHSTRVRTEPVKKPVSDSLSFSDVWRLRLSAAEFSQLIGHGENARVEESPTSYTIIYMGIYTGDTASNGLQSASLVLSRPELRPVSQT